jgi:hypothetical protein
MWRTIEELDEPLPLRGPKDELRTVGRQALGLIFFSSSRGSRANHSAQARRTVGEAFDRRSTVRYGHQGHALAISWGLSVKIRPVVVVVVSLTAALGSFAGVAAAMNRGPAVHSVTAANPKGYKVVTGATTTVKGSPKGVTVNVTCPAKTVAVGGGEVDNSGLTLDALSGSYPSGAKWIATFGKGSSQTITVHAEAVCITKPAGFKVVTKTVSNTAQSQTEGIASCPSGLVAIGGGVKTTSTLQQALNSSETGNGSNWVVYENNRDLTAHNYQVFVVCAKQPAGYTITSSSPFPNPGAVQATGDVTCPSGVPLSGGAESSSSDLYTDINESRPVTGGWGVTMNNVSSTPTTFTVQVICA